MRAIFLIAVVCGCGARTELAVPPDASSPILDAGHDVVQPLDVVVQPAPRVIATTDVPAYAITVDDENVYWTQGYWGSAPASGYPVAMQCDKASCQTPVALAIGVDVSLSIAVDDENVYWSASDSQWYADAGTGLLGCAIGGCAQAPQTIAAGLLHGVITYGDRLFWIGGDVVSGCLAGSCATSTVTLASGTGTVRTDGTYAYWSTDTAILRCRLGPTGCVSPAVVVVPDAPALGAWLVQSYRTFAMDSTNLYWLSHGEVRRCPKDGCSTPITIMPEDGNTAAQCIATDGVNVYWTAPSALVRCPVTGCAKPIPFYVSYGTGPNCLTLDATNVYWTTGSITGGCGAGSCGGGQIMTMPKP